MATERFEMVFRARGTREVQREIGRIGTQAAATRRILAFLRAALVVTASIRVFSGLVSGLAEFSQSMSTVRAVTQATNLQFQQLSDTARGLGATTRFTATEAAEGMVFLARTGFTAAESMDAVKDTLLLAQAGALDVASAADIASNILKTFGLEVSELSTVVDVLVATANNSNTSVTQLGEAMKFAGPSAAAFGISLEETAAAIGLLGDKGLQASVAGTGLSRLMVRLESPSTKLQKVIKKLGVDMDALKPSSVGLAQALKNVRDAGIGTAAGFELFGDRAGRIFAALEPLLDDIPEFEKKIRSLGGIAQKTADIMDDNLNGALLRVRSALESVLLAFGEIGGEALLVRTLNGLAEAFRALGRNIGDALEAIAAFFVVFTVARMLALVTVVGRLAKSFGVLTIAMFRTNGAFKGTLAFVARAITGFGLLNAVMRVNPFITVGLAIATVTSALFGMQSQLALTADKSVLLSDGLVGFGEVLRENVAKAFEEAGISAEAFDRILNSFSLDAVARGFIRLLANINGFVSAVRALFKLDLGDFVLLVFQTLINGIISDFERGINRLIGVANFLLRQVGFEPLDFVQLTRVNIPGANKAGADIAEAFQSGFDAVFRRTLAVADERRSDEFAKFIPGRKPTPPGAKDETDPGQSVAEILGDDVSKAVDKAARAVESLVSGISPLANNIIQVRDAQKALDEALDNGIDTVAEFGLTHEEIMRRVRRDLVGVGNDSVEAQENIRLVQDALRDGAINSAEATRRIRDINIELLESQTDAASGVSRFFLKLQKDVEDVASGIEEVMNRAMKGAEDAVVEFVQNGTFSFSNFLRDIEEQLLRSAVRTLLADLGGQLGFGSRPQQSLLGGLFGGNASGGGGGLFSGLGGLLGFQNGGSFTVGPGSSLGSLTGVDNRLVAFKAKDGERVTVTPPEQSGRPVQVNFNISTPDADSFRRSQGQILTDAQVALSRAARRNA